MVLDLGDGEVDWSQVSGLVQQLSEAAQDQLDTWKVLTGQMSREDLLAKWGMQDAENRETQPARVAPKTTLGRTLSGGRRGQRARAGRRS